MRWLNYITFGNTVALAAASLKDLFSRPTSIRTTSQASMILAPVLEAANYAFGVEIPQALADRIIRNAVKEIEEWKAESKR